LTGVVALAALTGLSFTAKPATAESGSGQYQYDEDGSSPYSDQYSPRDTRQHRQNDGDWSSGRDGRNRDRNQGGRSGCSNSHRSSRSAQWDQGGQWGQSGQGSRDCGRQYRSHRSYRSNHGYRHAASARNSGWGDQRYRNRGGCN